MFITAVIVQFFVRRDRPVSPSPDAQESFQAAMEVEQDLKTAQTVSLCRLTKSRNALSALLLKTHDALDEVKTSLNAFDESLKGYRDAHSKYAEYLQVNKKEEDAHREGERFFTNDCSALDFRARVTHWIREAEHQLSEEVSSSVTSSRKSTAKSVCSVKSARAHEEAKIAELKAKSKSLDQTLQLAERRAALLAEEKRLLLQTELEVAEARRKAFADAEDSTTDVKALDPLAPSYEPHPRPEQQLPELPEGVHVEPLRGRTKTHRTLEVPLESG